MHYRMKKFKARLAIDLAPLGMPLQVALGIAEGFIIWDPGDPNSRVKSLQYRSDIILEQFRNSLFYDRNQSLTPKSET